MHVSLCDQANPQWFGSDRLIFRNNCHTTTLHAPRSCQMELISLTTRPTIRARAWQDPAPQIYIPVTIAAAVPAARSVGNLILTSAGLGLGEE